MEWNLTQIFWTIGILGLITANVFVIALIYNALRFVVRTKKSLFEFLDSGEFKKLVKGFTGKSKSYEDEDFDNGYICGVRELLQSYYNEWPGGIEILMKEANFNVKNWGHFEIDPAKPPYKHSPMIIFVDKAKKEKQDESEG